MSQTCLYEETPQRGRPGRFWNRNIFRVVGSKIHSRRVSFSLLVLLVAIVVENSRQPVLAQTTSNASKKPDSVTSFPAKDKTQTSAADDPKRFQPFGYAEHHHEVKVSGKAVDEDGKLIAKARIFIVPVWANGVAIAADRKILAEGVTDQDGKYHFDNVPLTALEFSPAAVPKPTEALFQVFGIAEEYGYVWRHSISYRPSARGNKGSEPKSNQSVANSADETLWHIFHQDEPIVVDLEFSPEVRLHGMITDNHGNPLKDALVRIGLATTARQMPDEPPNHWLGNYLEDSRRGPDLSFHGFAALPEKFRVTRTDAEGQYEIPGVPRDCNFMVSIDYRAEYEPWVDQIQTGTKKQPDGAAVLFSGLLNHVFLAPVTVKVHVVTPDKASISGVIVRQDPALHARRVGSLCQTDDDGIAILKLPANSATLMIEPNFGQPFLPQKLVFDGKSVEPGASLDFTQELEPAAEVIFEAIEDQTGLPVEGIAFRSEPADELQRPPVESQLSFVDHPRTDQTGTMRAFFEPGLRRFLVDQLRSSTSFEAVSPITEFIELTPDKPTKVRFRFTRRNEPTSKDLEISDEFKPLAETLKKQRDLFERSQKMRFQVRRNNFIRGKLSRREMTELLDSLETKSIDESIEVLRRQFPEFRAMGKSTLVTDGYRRRVDLSNRPEHRVEVQAFNGQELLHSMDAGRQLDIYDQNNSNLGFLARNDFWSGPAQPSILAKPSPKTGQTPWTRELTRSNGVLEVRNKYESITVRSLFDEKNGFQFQESQETLNSPFGQDTRYFYPTTLANGVAAPQMTVRVRYQNADDLICDLIVVDQIEVLESLPPGTFVVAAAVGTNVIDYRGIPRDQLGGRRGASGVLRAAVPDVIAYRNQLAPAKEPILKVGQVAPKFNVKTWLNASGETTQPEMNGKTVVIDFWGIHCGPCVAQLPEVNEAARHFADSTIVIVGLHPAGSKSEDVLAFLQKKQLVFPTAIDQPDATSRTYGSTYASFGISGIPATVVINADGNVAYIGEFKQAIEIANKLAKGD